MLGATEPRPIRREPDPEVFMTFDDQVQREENQYLFQSPAFSAVLSTFVMGLGQIFNGQTQRGMVFLLGQFSLGLYYWDHHYGHVVSDALIAFFGQGPYSAFFYLLMAGGAVTWIYNIGDAYRVAHFLSFMWDRHSQAFVEDEPELGVLSASQQYGRRRGRTRQMAYVGLAVLLYTVSIFFLGSRLGRSGDGLDDLVVRLASSRNPELHLNAAQFFYRLGQFEKADLEYNRALEHAQSGPQRRLAEMGLERVAAALRGEAPEDPPDPVPVVVREPEDLPEPYDPGYPTDLGEPADLPPLDPGEPSSFDAPPPMEPGPEQSSGQPVDPRLVQPPSPGRGQELDQEYALERAELELSLGNLEGVEAAIQDLIDQGVESARLERIRGELARQGGRPDLARVAYERAISLAPGDPRAFLGLARLARAEENSQQEEIHLRRAVVANPVFPEAVREYADFLAGSGRAQQAHEVVARALTANPEDQDLLYRSFVYSRQAGNSERAYQAALALAREGYREGEIYEFLARRALEKDKLDEVRRHLQTLERLEPQQERTVLLQAEMARRARNPRKVIELLRPWVSQGSLETALVLAQAAKDARDYPVGIRALEAALEVHPPDAGAWKLLGILRKRTGDLRGALEAYQQALALDPADKEALYLAGYIQFRSGAWEEGIRLYEQVIRSHPGYGESDFYLGACYQGAGLYGKAREAFQRVPARSSNRAAAEAALAKLREQESLESSGAQAPGSSLPHVEPRAPEAPSRPVAPVASGDGNAPLVAVDFPPPAAPRSTGVSVDAYATQLKNAEVAFQESRMEEALRSYREVLRIKPDHFRSHFQSGLILREMGRAAEAVDAFQLARAINPKHVKNLTELGQLLAEETRFGAAVTIFEEALQEEPRNLAVRYKLGVLYEHQKNYPKAEEQYQAILWYHPDYTQAHEYLGNVYYRQGKYERALRAFDSLLQGDADNLVVRLKRALTRLQLGQPEKGRRELEELLAELPPEHSLRSQVETYLASLKG